MATKTKKAKRVSTGKPRRKAPAKSHQTNGEAASGVVIDADRLANAKEAERHLNDARLTYEEAKAKHGQAKAEVKLLTAKRNRIISTATTAEEVQEAQRLVTNAKRRAMTAKDVADAAKDELKGWEEQLQKALSGEQPLFDELKTEISAELSDRGILGEGE